MIYDQPAPNAPIDQGDIIDECPLPQLAAGDLSGSGPPEVELARSRVVILTQTCDLAQHKATRAVVAVVRDAGDLVAQGYLKAADVRGPIRAGRVYGWYFLPAEPSLGLSESIVDLRQLHTVRVEVLWHLAARGRRLGRLQPLYRAHLGKHFADTYSRIGLPEPYPSE